MATTKKDILGWLERGKKEKATHLLVVCDTFEYEDYPVFVSKTENAKDEFQRYNGKSMQRVMEVYDLSKDWETQLNSGRAFNF